VSDLFINIVVNIFIDDEYYDEYSDEYYSEYYSKNDTIIPISNLVAMMKSVFGNSVVSSIISNFTSDYLVENSIVDKIEYTIRSYGVNPFCEQIKIDGADEIADNMNKLITENTVDEKYISIGANLNALAVFIRKIIVENELEFVEMMLNPEIDDSERLLKISLFIEDDIDAMNAWKIITGLTKVFISILRQIALE